ncbi:MAG: MerR family transcriptional regulator [Gordonibacter pamelaeae]
MQQPLLLSTGEFARMCNVSRELLIHYDKIGLLKPKEVRENGYRYYSLRQLYLFDVIRFFSDTGMSMKEIKEYLDNRTTQLFLDSVQTSIDRMERQRDILDARISMMEKMRYITQRALTFPKDKPCLSYWDETWFAPPTCRRERTQQAYAEAFSAHADFCRNTIGVTGFPLGRIVDIPDLARPDDFYYTKLVTWISPPKSIPAWSDRVVRKPKGNYAVILHQGRHEHGRRLLREAAALREEGGPFLCGPVHELDMNSYLMSDAAEDYLLHISVLVDA